MIRRVQHEKLDPIHTEVVEYSSDVYGSRITGDEFGFDLVATRFATSAFKSIPIPLRPSLRHSINVVPLPAKGSSTQSFFLVYRSMSWCGICGMKLPQYQPRCAPVVSRLGNTQRLSVMMSVCSFQRFRLMSLT